MFSAINDVNWKSLKQAHGYSEAIPNAIMGLISPEKDRHHASYWQLDNHVVLQGDLYESAYYVIPFLVEILRSPITDGRNYVYDLLFEIANGYSEASFQNGQTLGEACNRAISDAFMAFLDEARNIDSTLREEALDLLITLRSHRNAILQELDDIRKIELNHDFASRLDEAISEIGS